LIENFEIKMKFFVGIDLGGEDHKVCIITEGGDILCRSTFAHSGAGLDALLNWLAQSTGPDPCAVGIGMESPRGVMVEALLERKYSVFSINPKQLDRFRDRFSVAGAKDDHRDALVAAHSLRTDRPCFRRLVPEHPKVLRLRELSRADDQIKEELQRAANQLGDFLRRYFPSLLTLCPGADERWLWALLERAPLPSQAARLTLSRLQKLLNQHRIRRFSAEHLHGLLQTKALPLAPGSGEAIAEQVMLLLPRLVLLRQQKSELDEKTDQLLEEMASDENYPEHRDVTILRSVPGLGRVFSATVLSEAHQALTDRDYRALRGLAGVAPVTRQSGKSRRTSMRRACNRRFRTALHNATAVHVQYDERARRQYAELRRQKHTHGRALRGVGDRLLALVISMLKHGTLYDAERRKVATVT
jgi:transposase